MKTCTKCHEEKQDEEFYQSKRTSTGLTAWCKECTKELSRQRGKNGKRQARSTKAVLRLLWRNGIPAFADRRIIGPWIDIVAWGCVPVEAKLASESGTNKFVWTFSPGQLQELEGFIVLVAYFSRKKRRVLVLPTTAIPEEKIENHDGSRSICVTFDSFHPNSNWPVLRYFEDRFDLIDNARLEYARKYTQDMLGNNA